MMRLPSAAWIDQSRFNPNRWAPEYYKDSYVQLEKRLEECRLPLKRLGGLGHLFSGPFGSELPSDIYRTPSGVPLLRVQNIGLLFLELDHLALIPDEVHQQQKRSQVAGGDLVLAKAGRLGAVSRIPAEWSQCNITQHVIGARIRSGAIDTGYLVAFLLSKYGRFQFERQGVGTLTKFLGVEDARAVLVPVPGNEDLQRLIGSWIDEAERLRLGALTAFQEASLRLSSVLSLDSFSPRVSRTNWVSEICPLDRLTADFYLPRYLDLENHIRAMKRYARIGELVREPVLRATTPDRAEDGAVPCVLTSDIDPQLIRWHEPSLRVTQTVYSEHFGSLQEFDVLYTSVGPPVGEAAVVLPEFLPLGAGGDVSIIRTSDGLDPGYLCLYLNSMFGQMQNERFARGIRQRRVYPEDISAFLVPVPSHEDQEFIGSRVTKMERLNETGLVHLKRAISSVESLIEGR